MMKTEQLNRYEKGMDKIIKNETGCKRHKTCHNNCPLYIGSTSDFKNINIVGTCSIIALRFTIREWRKK